MNTHYNFGIYLTMTKQSEAFLKHFWFNLPKNIKNSILVSPGLFELYNRFLNGQVEDSDFFLKVIDVRNPVGNSSRYYGLKKFLEVYGIGDLIQIDKRSLKFKAGSYVVEFDYQNENELQQWEELMIHD